MLIPLQEVHTGDYVRAEDFNKLIRNIKQLIPIAGKGVRICQTAAGAVINATATSKKEKNKSAPIAVSGDSCILGKIKEGTDGAYTVTLLPEGPAGKEGPTALVIAPEVAGGANLPRDTLVICHPVGMSEAFGMEDY